MFEFGTTRASFNYQNGLYIRKGATWHIDFTVNTIDPETGKVVPKDLTGWTGTCQIRSSADSTEVIATPTVDLSDRPTEGIFSLSLTAEQTSMIPAPGEECRDITYYTYDILFTKGSEVERVMNGLVAVSPNVTR